MIKVKGLSAEESEIILWAVLGFKLLTKSWYLVSRNIDKLLV